MITMSEEQVIKTGKRCFLDASRECDSTCQAFIKKSFIDLNYDNKKDEDEPEFNPCSIIHSLEAAAQTKVH
jgi:hypothetical protein